MIDIIIPAYNSHKTIDDTIKSIVSQNISNKLKVYICNDFSKYDYSQIIDKYNSIINIVELKLNKNMGPGAARQYGIEHSSSEFIIFIDSDDVFYDEKSVEKLYKKIVETNSDVVIGRFLEEYNGNYRERDTSFTWLHGKIYKRDFIVNNNIKFSFTYSNEDTFFNRSIAIRNPKVDYVNDVVYIYKENENSITRRNNREYAFDGIFGYIDNMTNVLIDAIDSNVDKDNISNHSTCMMISIYFFYLENHENIRIDDVINCSKKMKEIFDVFRFTDKNIEKELYEMQFRIFNDSYQLKKISNPVISFDEFLKLYNKSFK